MDVINKLQRSLLIFTLFVFIGSCSHIDEETPRGYVRLLSADTLEIRKQIGLQLLAGNLISPHDLVLVNAQGLSVAKVNYGRVTSGGTIITYNEEYETLVVFEPNIEGDEVLWRCDVYPKTAKPRECGEWN